MNSVIRHRSVYTAVGTILDQNEQEQYWSLYLAYVSNPLIEDVSFEEFMSRVKSDEEKAHAKSSRTVQKTVNKQVNVEKQVLKAELMLKEFVPQKKGGAD